MVVLSQIKLLFSARKKKELKNRIKTGLQMEPQNRRGFQELLLSALKIKMNLYEKSST